MCRLIQLDHWLLPTLRMPHLLIQEAVTDGSMDYFAYSPFWDPKSNNNVLRVQRRIEQPTYGHAEEKL
jgi:mediator of RNA polymerase II transcription subunit 6